MVYLLSLCLLCFSCTQVIDYYLDRLIFPETMEHRGLKLAANGQDVGGDMLFDVKLGFSGTPSDLLPLELGRLALGRRHLLEAAVSCCGRAAAVVDRSSGCVMLFALMAGCMFTSNIKL